MMNQCDRLLRLLVDTLNRIIGQCVVERRLPPSGGTLAANDAGVCPA